MPSTETTTATSSHTKTTSSRRAVEPVVNSLALKREWEHSLRVGRPLTKEESKDLHDKIDAWRSIGQSHASIDFAHNMINEAVKVFVDTEKELSSTYNFDVKTDIECEKDTAGNIELSQELVDEKDYLEQVARVYCIANMHLQMAVKELVSLKGVAGDPTKGGRFRIKVEAEAEESVAQETEHSDAQENSETVEPSNQERIDEPSVTTPANVADEPSKEFPASITTTTANSNETTTSDKKKKRSISVTSRMLPGTSTGYACLSWMNRRMSEQSSDQQPLPHLPFAGPV